MSGTIFDIRKFSINDGPGIRTTVFFKGCPLACAWCHNPESQSFQPQMMLWESRCSLCQGCLDACSQGAISLQGVNGTSRVVTNRDLCNRCGACTDTCASQAREMVGRTATVNEVMAAVERDRAFYEESGGGVTISGGEPLGQPTFLHDLLEACRTRDLHTVVDTSGYAQWKAFERIIPLTNLFLFDLKHLDDHAHRHWTGVSNISILNNLRNLAAADVPIIVRVPIIPGINDAPDHLAALADLVSGLPTVQRTDLLPYHASAAGKYTRLGLTYSLDGTPSPSAETMQKIAAVFQVRGLATQIGG